MEDNFNRFIKIYKRKNYSELVTSTIEIKSSSISKYEQTLKNTLRSIDFNKQITGQLIEQKLVLDALIQENSPAIVEINERLEKIHRALNNGKY